MVNYSNQSLQEASKRITEAMYSMREECVENLSRLQNRLDELTVEYREAAAQGDLRENSAYQEAGDELNSVNRDIVRESERLLRLDELGKYEAGYVHIGLVIEMSTVRLIMTYKNKQSVVVLKVLPKGISCIEKNMIASDAPLAQALFRKSVGKEVTLMHRMDKSKIVYKIIEIF